MSREQLGGFQARSSGASGGCHGLKTGDSSGRDRSGWGGGGWGWGWGWRLMARTRTKGKKKQWHEKEGGCEIDAECPYWGRAGGRGGGAALTAGLGMFLSFG